MAVERVVATFIELVKIDSESKNEGKFQAYLKTKFEKLGLDVYEDDTIAQTGLGANNLVCRLAGNTAADALFFSCHVDTVTPGVGIKPIIKEGAVYSDGTTILAADDKAGIAIMIELIEQLKENNEPHGTVEFVLSPGEEIGLVGASAFDVGVLEADYGFVLDNGGPVGSITVGSPTLYGIEVTIKGITAHAGLEPEKGVSAIEIAAKAIAKMKLGRLDADTTANIGTINGGTASNIVADEVKVFAEARSISHEACEAQVKHMTDLFIETAKELGGTATVVTDIKSVGYRFTKESKTVKLAAEAITKINRTPNYDISGGGSDANVFNAKGKETANLSIGYEKIHTVHEMIPIIELKKAVELAYQLVKDVGQK
ncbi:M20/M25/M40 family metallo-hydrolase [Carnobacterium maltaromaticum]|uniref:M42 glutamyl aminopeptidase family protein n=1 Tax=Carnobacterium maltaromaticum LMA28 TaxID=1234679 RepID=K8E5H4_CARML|nr:M20/M25/M40 family metallo-hydrolase [Carnobacterium maltaromaticum]KRN67941.1 deacylase [Carnobacterium maltaromaticum DSM 20342]CCO12002.2 M42 glutamyl aminopeptidase family protein [Carnobacterium maltaromaticum LMA28]